MLHTMLQGARPETRPEPLLSSQLLVTFTIGTQEYGLPVAEVLEIVRLPALIRLAGAPAVVCGLLNLRGRYLPVLDGRCMVGEPSLFDLNSQIVIVGHDRAELGVLVDQVRDVRAYQSERLMALGDSAAPFLSGVIDSPHGSVLLLDRKAMLALVPAQAER